MHLKQLFLLILCALPLAANSSETEALQQELAKLEAELAPYQLPTEANPTIPNISFQNAQLSKLIELCESNGLEVLVADTVKDVRINIQLRNLSLDRILGFCTRQVGANWLYDGSRVIIFRDYGDLNASYRAHCEHRQALRRKIGKVQERLKLIELSTAYITEFNVNQLTLHRTIEQLSEATVANKLGPNGSGYNIVPLFDAKQHTSKHSYTFRNRSLPEILDEICEDQGFEWDAGETAITIQKKR